MILLNIELNSVYMQVPEQYSGIDIAHSAMFIGTSLDSKTCS